MKPDFISECGSVQLYHADCRDVLSLIRKADAIITDPPYGIGFAAQPTKWQRLAGKQAESWDDSTIPDAVLSLPSRAAICVIWGGNYYPLPCTRGWLMWRKPDAPPSMAHGELAWTSLDANLKVIDCSISSTNAERVGHPTQKPLRVMGWTMEQVGVSLDALVLDPFMGSGTTGVACVRTGRRFIGIEKDPTHYATALERIKRELAQLHLFKPEPQQVEPDQLALAVDPEKTDNARHFPGSCVRPSADRRCLTAADRDFSP